MAGSDLPDIMLFNGGLNVGPTAVPNLAQFLEQSMADLTPYLGGDAGEGLPLPGRHPDIRVEKRRVRLQRQALHVAAAALSARHARFIKNVDIWNQEFGADYVPKNADDFKRMLVQVTNPRDGRYGLGGSAGVVSGGALGLQSMLRLFPSIFGAPNNWRLDGSNLVKDYETPEYRESIALFARPGVRGCVLSRFADQSGGTHNPELPDRQGGHDDRQLWRDLDLDVHGPANRSNRSVNWLPIAPFAAHDGAKPVHYLGPGFLVTLAMKKAPPERLKELLSIVDWLTAPFGSAEDLLLTYGMQGVDHTLDEAGRPIATPKASPDVDAVGWKYISQRPQVMTWPAWPDYAKVAYDFEHMVIPVGVSDPTLGVVSPTNFAKGVQINQVFTDAHGRHRARPSAAV